MIAGANPTVRVRASNFGVQMKQEQTFPPLIDGIVDVSAYQLGMKTVEGDIAFPLIHEGTAVGSLPTTKASGTGCGQALSSFAGYLWQVATERNEYARMSNTLDIGVVYPDNSQKGYPGTLINSMSWKVTQGGPVDVSVSVIGGTDDDHNTRIENGLGTLDGYEGAPNYLSPARIVTWNDFSLAIYSEGAVQIKDGTGIREFSAEVKNNVERYATLNGLLVPQDIAAKKREITGSIKLLGRNSWLNYWGVTNETRFTSDEHIAFGYKIGANNFYWATALHGVIFKIEEMTIAPGEVFETTVGYQATGDCAYDYDAAEFGTNPAAGALPNPTTNDQYGGTTRINSDGVSAPYPSATPFEGWVDNV